MKPRDQNALYETMRDAIAYLRAHAKEQPSAAEVARAVGMSVSRFEHAFAEWAGTTPKRFLGYLTKERAKEQLRASRDVLAAAHAAGLSGPARLHGLMITHEAVTPGEFRSGDIAIAYGIHPSPFGWCLIGVTARGICQLTFMERESDEEARSYLLERWPRAAITRDQSVTAPLAEKIFGKGRGKVPLLVRGTNFQIKVWEALLRIPEGRVADYATIARMIGAPKAVRAVGTACGSNAIAYLIPCHRVLGSDGGMGGYRWGTLRKEAMLAREGI